MTTKHASITARIEALDSQYSQAQQIYKTTRSRTEQDKALKAMQEAVIILELTPHDLTLLPDTQLTEYQKSLIVHMDTPNEQKARQVNRMINDEKHRRSGYGD